MTTRRLNPQTVEPKGKGRPVGGTEYSCYRAVLGGTGIAVLAVLVSKPPNISRLQNAIDKLQNLHPILKSRLIHSSSTVSFITSPAPFVEIKSFPLSSTSTILERLSSPQNHSNINISPFHLVLEHELNQNTWNGNSNSIADMFFASIYALPNTKWVVVLRLHFSACDRTTAMSLLRELPVLMGEGGGETEKEMESEGEVNLGMEDLIPRGKAKKPLWARGVDMLNYSVSSLRLTNLKFQDPRSPRSSEVIRLQFNQTETHRILSSCKSRAIKLCGALVAAGLIAAYNSKRRADNQGKKYAVVTLIDCRSLLDPPLSSHHFGMYHSAIPNTHLIKGGEKLWKLAQKTYNAFENSKKCNKHFSDMADLNLLMGKAIENPGLTASSSLRTSFMSVFEVPVIDDDQMATDMQLDDQIGLEDYMWCTSIHGIGPSIAIVDTIRDGCLDCVCVYPAPLHSREQMQELIDKMKAVLVDGDNYVQE